MTGKYNIHKIIDPIEWIVWNSITIEIITAIVQSPGGETWILH